MTTIESSVEVLDQPGPAFTLSEDKLAAVAFLARYRGRTLEAYRHDLRCLFQWAADHGLALLGPPGPTWSCTGRRWKSAAWRRRRSTGACPPPVASPLRAHRRPHPLEPGSVCPPPPGPPVRAAGPRSRRAGPLPLHRRALRSRPRRPSRPARPQRPAGPEACDTNIEDIGMERGHRVLRIVGKAKSRPSSRWCPAPPAPSICPSANAGTVPSWSARMATVWTGGPPTGGCSPWASEPDWARSTPTCFGPGSSWPPSTPAFPSETSS